MFQQHLFRSAMIPSLRVSPARRRCLRTLLLLLLGWCLLLFPAHAQAPTWQTLITPTQASGNNRSEVMATATDTHGNVYLAGYFAGTVNFGSTALTSSGALDMFVAKWSPATGRFLWAQRAGGREDDGAWGITVSGAHVYLTGFFHSAAADFGPTTLTNAGAALGAYSDMFVAKLTEEGTFVWTQRAGGADSEYPKAIAVSGNSVYIAGSFFGASATFGSTTLQNAGGAGSRDLFLTKLTDAGTTSHFTWVQRAGGTGDDYANGLVVTAAGLYLVGAFQSATMTFGGLTVTNAEAPSPPLWGYDVFAVKLTDAGASPTYGWAQQAGGAGLDVAEALAVSGPNVYLVGAFRSATIAFGGTTLANDRPGTDDLFVTKLVDVGATAHYAWAQRAGGSAHDAATRVAVRENSVYVAGYFASPTADFGSTLLRNAATEETTDVFVAKLTDAGNTAAYTWAQQGGGEGNDTILGLAVQGTTVYVGGIVAPPARFGGQTIGTPTNTTVAFLASVADELVTSTRPPVLPGLSLYPNPARHHVTVQVPALAGATHATVTLTDALGRMRVTHTVVLSPAGTTEVLDLAGIAPGVYAWRVQAGAASALRHLMIE